MDSLYRFEVKEAESITRNHLKVMCKGMVRKDFEILRIQDALYSVFNNTEFYSKYSDELLSIKHSVELASGEVLKDELDSVYWGMVSDAAMALAFQYKERPLNCIQSIAENANALVDTIFESCLNESDVGKQKDFIRGFKQAFPGLNISFIERRNKELCSGTCTGLSFGG